MYAAYLKDMKPPNTKMSPLGILHHYMFYLRRKNLGFWNTIIFVAMNLFCFFSDSFKLYAKAVCNL